jgi:hypothetical protein
MDRAVAPDGETIGAGPVETRELHHVGDILVRIEMADDVGPLARRRDRRGAGPRAVGQALDGLDVYFAGLLLQRSVKPRARPDIRRRVGLAATSDANEKSRHSILLSFGASPRQ